MLWLKSILARMGSVSGRAPAGPSRTGGRTRFDSPVFEPLEPYVLLSGDIAVGVDPLATADTTPALTGTVDDAAAAVVVRVDGVNYDAVNNGDGSWTLADDEDGIETPLANGTYDVVVLATNSGAGTFGFDDTTDELVIDTVAPIVTVDELVTNALRPGLTGEVNDPDATLVVTVDGVDYSALNNGNGTWTLPANVVAVLGEATYDVAVAATDAESDVGTDDTTDELIVDRTGPTVTVDALITNDDTPELTGTVNDNDATITVEVDGRQYAATNNEDGTWTLANNTVTALADAVYDVSVTATDEAGNTGTDATDDELDVRIPPVVRIDALATTDTTPELTGTVSDPDATISVNVDGADYAATNNGDGSWTLADDTVAVLAEGPYDVVVSATSLASLVGTDDTVYELVIDGTAPTVTIDALSTADTTPELTGTVDEADAEITVTLDGQEYTAVNNADGTWRLFGILVTALDPGTYDVAVTATDPAENEGTDATTDELDILPTVGVDTLTTGDTTPELTGTVNDPTATISVNVDGADYAATNNGDDTWTLADDTVAALAEGTFEVTATATLGALVNTDETAEELTVDTSAPVVAVDAQDPTAATRPEITGTVSDPEAVVGVEVAGNTYIAVNNGDGTWTLAAGRVSPLSPGTYTVTATATDAAENEGTGQADIEIVDLPVVRVDALSTDDTTPELTGTVSDPGVAITVSVDGADYAATNNGDGTWTVADGTVAALAEGTYDVTATATVSGLEATDNTTDELVIDTTAPTVTVNELETEDTTPNITGTVDDPAAEISVVVNGTTYDAINIGNGTWTLSGAVISVLPAGTYDVAVTATDDVDNAGTDSTTDELDILPVVTVDTLVTSDTTPELTGTVSDAGATISVNVGGADYAATNNGDGTWTLADDSVAALGEGVHDVTVTVTLGALTNTDDTFNELTIDTIAPVVTMDGRDPTAQTQPSFSGSVSDPDAAIEVAVAGATYAAANNGDGSWTLVLGTIAPLTPGSYTVIVTATDDADNEDTAQITIEIVSPPIVRVDALSTSDTTPELTGTVSSADATISVNVGGADYAATNNGDGTWTLADDAVAALDEGTYDVTVTATLPSGVDDTDDTLDELMIDTTAPTVTVNTLETEDRTPNLSGTVSDADAEVIITLSGRDYTAVNIGNGTWSLSGGFITELNPGTYDVAATATDAVDNEATDATTDELDILPTLTVDTLITSDTTPELTGTVNSTTATVSVNVGGADYAAVNNGDGTWTVPDDTIAVQAEGTHEVVATATLGALTNTDDTFNELTIDTVAPVVTVDAQDPTIDIRPEITGTVSDPDAAISVEIAGGTYAADNNGDGTWTLPSGRTAALSPNTYTVDVTATDGADNEGTAQTDIEIVALPVVRVDELATDDTTPELTGTVSDPDATISVNVDGADYAAVNNGDGTWTLADGTVAALAEGTYDVTATATVGVDLEATDATTDELVIDLTAPIVTVEELETEDTTPTISGAVNEPDADVVVTVNGDEYDAMNLGNGTWTIPGSFVTLLPPGLYDVSATATDPAGHEGTDATTDELSILPVVTVDDVSTSDSTPALTGTVNSTAATISVNVDGADYAATNNGDGSWTLADDTIAALADGTYEVVVTATLGTLTNTDDTFNELSVDTGAPVATVDTLDATEETRPELTGTVSDVEADISVEIDGRVYDGVNLGDGTWRLDAGIVSALDEGIFTITVTATDAAGNEGTGTGSIEVEIPPVVSVNPLTTNEASPELTGTVDDVDAVIVVNVNGADYTATHDVDDENLWTLAAGLIAALPEATYDVSVTATDTSGHEGTDTTVNELVIDTTPPRSVTVDPMDPTNDTSPQLTGTVGEAEATVTVTVNGEEYDAVNHGDGTWTLGSNVIDNLPQGTYDVVATATDPAGNSRTDDTTDELVILTSAPTVTVDPLTTTYTSPQLTGTVDDVDATIEVLVNGNIYDATNNGDGTWTLEADEIAPLGAGTYDVTVMATNYFGNIGLDATRDELRVRNQTTVTLQGGGVRYVYYTDPDGSTVTVSLAANLRVGPLGMLSLSFASNSLITLRTSPMGMKVWVECDAGALLTSMSVLAKTKGVTINARGGTVKGTTLGGVAGGSELFYLRGRWVDLIDNGIFMPGAGIQKIFLRNIQEADVMMFGMPIKGVSLKVYEAITNSNIWITDSNIKSLMTGSLIDSTVFVGVLGAIDANGDSVGDLPETADLLGGLEITRLKITGYRGALGNLFANSNIAADTVGRVDLMNAGLENFPDTDGDGEADDEQEPFGVTTNTVGKLTLKQGGVKYVWDVDAEDWLGGLVPLDLEIRVP